MTEFSVFGKLSPLSFAILEKKRWHTSRYMRGGKFKQILVSSNETIYVFSHTDEYDTRNMCDRFLQIIFMSI